MPHPESKEAVAARLEVTRLALGFKTQAAFAAKMSADAEPEEIVTPQRWNNYESGRDRLTLNLALIMCHKFPQITLDWIYRGDKSTLRQFFSVDVDDAERVLKRLR